MQRADLSRSRSVEFCGVLSDTSHVTDRMV